jgi:cell division protein FtsN
MDRRTNQSGYELVLDVRRLIVAFALLTLVCGAFFVLGFVEGKRQAVQMPPVEAAAPAPAGIATQDTAQATAPQAEPSKEDDKAVRQQLDWYDSVSGRKQPNADAAGTALTGKAAPSKAAAVPAKPVAAVAYSCQVGAFSQSKEAEAKAASLRSRGFDPVIEAPSGNRGLYLLKVGHFGTRSEAAAMQLRLKKDGISSFIKSNR